MHESALESLPDFAGDNYLDLLDRLHRQLRPKSYVEIGTAAGDSLALARCASLAVDPNFTLSSAAPVSNKPLCALYQMPSDKFFATVDPTVVLGRRIDLAFLDGMHLSEFLLRDFLNVERFCHSNSVIVLHDCLPLHHIMAKRKHSNDRQLHPHRMHWWTGDVWRCALLLKRRRRDLRIIAVDAPPTGLVLITNPDPSSTFLSEYPSLVKKMHAFFLRDLTLTGLHRELNVESTSALKLDEISLEARRPRSEAKVV
jgi:methyltransferase family protein